MITAEIKKERKSAAVTLSDMEIFVFPDLMYSLVLANIMSSRIWEWRRDPWFKDIDNLSPYRRVQRLKQYIIEHYIFNLDLDTWGLTTKQTEINRFSGGIDEEILSKSNALFGYEGDRYYFDIDIRRHFGLDKYDQEIIPYWKTETVEAMDAFKHKKNYKTGAGECVSFAGLYAASLFVIAKIPLKDIYLMATPLHSQNFIDIEEGVLTNNRRILTRKMWVNGTELSGKARRALENEKVTIVSHETGYIHTIYQEATISAVAYSRFKKKIKAFLEFELTPEVLGNFLRCRGDLHKCFQIRWKFRGNDYYVGAERVFAYEKNFSGLFTDNSTRKKLMKEIDFEEFHSSPMTKRIVLNDLEDFIRERPLDMSDKGDVSLLKNKFQSSCFSGEIVIKNLINFCVVKPQLPKNKDFSREKISMGLNVDMDREQIIAHLETIRAENTMVDLAFYAYRDLNRTEVEPFIQAALKRNPVSIENTKDLVVDLVIERVLGFACDSIYSETGRLAQPDEVWNYNRGDGVEKALLLANIFYNRDSHQPLEIKIDPHKAILKYGTKEISFPSEKKLKEQVWKIAD